MGFDSIESKTFDPQIVVPKQRDYLKDLLIPSYEMSNSVLLREKSILLSCHQQSFDGIFLS